MNKTSLLFTILVIYPMTLNAENAVDPEANFQDIIAEDVLDAGGFDSLPIDDAEVKTITNLFWNAGSIQETVRTNLPANVKNKFTRSIAGQGCDVKAVTKTEGSADTCEMSDDPLKMAKFIYNFDISCNFGAYKVAVCSREERKLLNQLKVDSPEKIVSEEPKTLAPEPT